MRTNNCILLNNNDALNVNWTSKLDTSNNMKQISFLSWNILSQNLFDSTPKWYKHVKSDAPVSWVERFPRIVSEILESRADVICLQEVEFLAYENDFQSTMEDNGYSSIMQKGSRKRAEDGGYGVATFWRKDRFQLCDSIHRSRTMVAILSDVLNPEYCLAVVNCHLEGHPEKSVIRVRQLQRCFHELSTKHQHHRLVICGDFNCMMSQSAAATYMRTGSVDTGQLEWGKAVDESVSVIPPHIYSLRSAYTMELLEQSPMDYITFVNEPENFTFALDQIWYHDSTDDVLVKGLRNPFHSFEHRKNILKSGLPSEDNPSDHLAIGCILEWKNDHPKNLLCSDENEFDSSDMDADECEKEALALLSSCPFSSKQEREEFMYCISEVPGMTRNAKPATENQIFQIRNRRARKKKLLENASKEVRKVLERVIHLINAARAKRNRAST